MNNAHAVKANYRVTFSDLNDALLTYERSERSYVNAIIGTSAIVFALIQFYLFGLTVLGFGLLAIGIFILARVYVIVASLLLYRRYRNTYETIYDVTVDNDGVHAIIGALDATRTWEGYQLVIENERSFVFIYAKMGFFAIPKRALTSEAESQLRALIQENAPNFRSLAT
jgi:hypothetical protein